MTSFDLPLVPSLNNAYGNKSNGKGRYAKPHIKAWKAEAGWIVKLAKPAPIVGPYKLTVLVATKMRGDTDNRIKIASDLLVAMKVIPDDHKAVSTLCERDASIAEGRCTIVVEGRSNEHPPTPTFGFALMMRP